VDVDVTYTTAMHMSDGLVDARTSALFYVVAALAVALAAWRARSELDERSAPVAGLLTGFLFALQMVAVPVLPDVSGHVLGGALAAILAGPFTGALCVTVVLVVQALVFADGGLSALGTNITNMAVIGVAAGYLTAVFLRALLQRPLLRNRVPRAPLASPAVIAFVAGFVSIGAATTGFVVEYAFGGVVVPFADVAYLYGAHIPVAMVEGLVTAAVVVAIAWGRPDAVHLFHGAPRPARSGRMTRVQLMGALGLAALVVAGALSPLASSSPDALDAATRRGCEISAEGIGAEPLTGDCMARNVREHRLADGALAGYTVGDRTGSTGIAGLIGVVLAFVVAGASFRALARPRDPRRKDAAPVSEPLSQPPF
jgi:cobalt/nickel transport system permease protein